MPETLSIRVLALLALVACACIIEARAAGPSQKPEKAAQYPGYGVVEAITPVASATAKTKRTEPSASAGASAARPAAYRLRIRMDDGRVQLRTQVKPEVGVGERVLVTNAGYVVPE
jgi:hypothetical protein